MNHYEMLKTIRGTVVAVIALVLVVFAHILYDAQQRFKDDNRMTHCEALHENK